jgi:acyl-CoA synthetase (AMP-forming)/AMP-acid ligase II
LEAPERPALTLQIAGAWRQISYSELAGSMDAWAASLHGFRPAGSAPGTAVAIIVAQHGLEAYASFLGAMRAGLVACFLPRPTPKQDPDLYWSNHRDVLARINPAVVVAQSDILDALRAILPETVPVLDGSSFAPNHQITLPPMDEIDGDRVAALLQHSSGTTGLKKGVVLTHGQIRHQVASYASAIDMSASDGVVSWLPLYHDMGLITSFLMPLSLGAPIAAMDPFDWLARPDSILIAAARFRSSFCWLPNFAFAHLVNTADETANYDLSSVRAFLDCSEPCRAETIEAFETRFSPHGLRPGAVATCYAMAETVFAVTNSVSGESPRILSVDGERLSASSEAVLVPAGTLGSVRLVSCGVPIQGTSVRISTSPARAEGPLSWLRRRRVVPSPVAHGVGEIQVQSGSAFGGYHGDKAASSACMDGGWYKTGDLGFLHDGQLYVCGRLKDLIIVNGRNFYAHDIEAVAGGVMGVKPGRAVAFGIERAAAGSDGAVLLAETVTTEVVNDRDLARAISKAVFDVLGLTLHHVGVLAPGVLVKTTSGKISRSENRLRYAREHTA